MARILSIFLFSLNAYFQWRRRMAMAMRRIIRTTVKFASKEERSSCVTPVQELITWSAWILTWKKHPRASGAAHTV